MRIGDLVRSHGGLISTAPVGLVIGQRTSSLVENYEKLRVLWVNGPRAGKQNWEAAHKMEKVI